MRFGCNLDPDVAPVVMQRTVRPWHRRLSAIVRTTLALAVPHLQAGGATSELAGLREAVVLAVVQRTCMLWFAAATSFSSGKSTFFGAGM